MFIFPFPSLPRERVVLPDILYSTWIEKGQGGAGCDRYPSPKIRGRGFETVGNARKLLKTRSLDIIIE
jgi:hypothetical protein